MEGLHRKPPQGLSGASLIAVECAEIKLEIKNQRNRCFTYSGKMEA
jgi:hypothetical protein